MEEHIAQPRRGRVAPKVCRTRGRTRRQVRFALRVVAPAVALAGMVWIGDARAGQLPASAFQAYNAANAATIQPGPFALYTVSLSSIVPTQANLGFAEVDKKAAGFNVLTSSSALSADLLTAIEPVVIGPGGVLYLTDGHHTFVALADSGWGASNPTVYVNVIANFSNLTPQQFWTMMEQDDLLFPVNDGVLENVNLSTGAPLPSTLSGMTSDVYRGLEYSILKNKSSKLFSGGSTTPGLDKTAGFYSDFIWADAYRGAKNGLGLPYLSPYDISLATNWNLTGTNTTTLPNASGGTTGYTVSQLPGYILSSSITITGTVSNATLANGTLDGSSTGSFDETTTFASFNGLRALNLGPVTIGSNAPGFIMQLGNDSGATVTLTGNNTYTGGTTILAGTLIVNGDAALGAAAPSNPSLSPSNVTAGVEAANGIIFNSLTEGNGTLRITSSFSTNRPIAVDGEVANIDTNGNSLTLTGQILSVGALSAGISNATGEGDLTLNDNTKNGTLILAPSSGANPNFYGNLIITAGTLEVGSDAAMGNTSGPSYEIGQIILNGGTFKPLASFNSVRSLSVQSNSTFDTNGTATSFASFSDNQRNFTFENSDAGTAGAVTFAAADFGSSLELTINGGSGSTSTAVTFTNGITRDGNAAIFLKPASGAFGTREQVLSGVTPTLTNGIAAPWLLIDSGASSNPYDFATYGANGYTAFSGYAGSITAATASSVVKQASSATLAANTSAFALNIQKGDAVTVTGHALTLGDGTDPAGLILNGGSGSGITGGTLAFGGSEALIAINGSSTISSTITGSGGLTLTGTGTLTLSAASNLSGLVTIDSGTLALSAANVFSGDASGLFLEDTKKLATAQLQITANNAFTTLDSAGNNSSIGISNGAALTIGDTSTNLNSTLSSTITETGAAVTGALTKNGSGLLDLSGASVSFATGSTVAVNGGVLRIGNGVFGSSATTAINLASGTELQYVGNGGSVFNDPVTGSGVFHLLSGTVQLKGANTYTGGTVLELGSTLDVTTSTVSTGNANIVSAGGTVVFDQTAVGTYSGVISDGLEAGGPNNPNSLASGSCVANAANASATCFAGSLIKDDSTGANSGNVTLGAVQAYTGATYVEAGTLTLGVADAIKSSSGVDLGRVGGNAVATLALGADNTIGALASETGNTTSVLLNGHTLTVNQATGSTVFGGNISDSGTGNFVKSGGGALILDGTNAVGGTTSVTGGVLAIGDAATPGASLSSAVTVGAAGVLMGHGTITGAVSSSGMVAPGGSIGTLTVNGGYSQAAGGVLAIELNPSAASKLAVGGTPGTASLAGTLAILPDGGVYGRGTSYQIVTASGGVSGSFASVTNALSQYIFTPIYKANEVDLELTGFQPTADSLSGNQQGVFNALQSAPIGSATDALFNAIGNMSGSAQSVALDGLQAYGAVSNQTVSTTGMAMFQDAMGGRASADADPGANVKLAQLVGDGVVAVPFGSYTVWTQGFGQVSKLDTTAAAPGQSSSVGGGTVGLELPVDPRTRIGAALGYASSSVSVSGLAQTATLNSYALGVYGGRWYGALEVDGALTVAYDQSDTSRYVAENGLSPKGNTDGYGAGASAAASYRIPFGALWLKPRFGFEYDYDYQAGYTESGGGAADLSVLSTHRSSVRSAAGTSLYGHLSDPNGDEITPEFRAAWLHQWLNPTPHVEERFAALPSAAFSTIGTNPGRDAALLGAGLSFNPRNGNTIFYVQYDAILSAHEADHAIRGGLKIYW